MRIWTKMPKHQLDIQSFATEDLEIACREYRLHANLGILCLIIFALALFSKPTPSFAIVTVLLVAGIFRCLRLHREIRAELEQRSQLSQA